MAIKELWICFVISVCINSAFYPKVRLIYLKDKKVGGKKVKVSRPLATSSKNLVANV